MKKDIFPIDSLENTTVELSKKHHIRTNIIYLLFLFFASACLILSFFIQIDISINSSGIIKTPGQRISINSPVSGKIEKIYVEENTRVDQGELILDINTLSLRNQAKKIILEIQKVNRYISDLQKLSKGILNDSLLATSLYKQSLKQYVSEVSDLENKASNIVKVYERSEKLLKLGTISHSEFEPIKSEYDNINYSIQVLNNRQIKEWQSELDKYLFDRHELDLQNKLLEIKISESLIKSPSKGVIQSLEGLKKDIFVQQGQKLIEISTDSILVVECLVPPKDISYVNLGEKVKIQIDAYKYTEWGFAEGNIMEIYEDVLFVNTVSGDMPFFRVICSLNTPNLSLKNGYLGEIKRGMTTVVRFNVARRTIFQLFHDRINDWMNPNISENNETLTLS